MEKDKKKNAKNTGHTQEPANGDQKTEVISSLAKMHSDVDDE